MVNSNSGIDYLKKMELELIFFKYYVLMLSNKNQEYNDFTSVIFIDVLINLHINIIIALSKQLRARNKRSLLVYASVSI